MITGYAGSCSDSQTVGSDRKPKAGTAGGHEAGRPGGQARSSVETRVRK